VELQFRWLGGALCLDFCNTVAWDRPADGSAEGVPRPEYERLTSYARLVEWGQAAHVLTDAEARRLLETSEGHPEAACRALDQAHEHRRGLHRLFLSASRGERPPADTVGGLNAALASALPHLAVEWQGSGLSCGWRNIDAVLDQPLWPVTLSAAQLATSQNLRRVRECSGDRCGFLFVDRSRNGRRRWCDMAHCGNRAKARRHYARTHSRALPVADEHGTV
jgi:predicted RNA-binding Zn ribbon-like protein